MKSRDVVGRRVVAVHQLRRHDGRIGMYTHIQAIELEGGVFLLPDTREHDYEYGQEMLVVRPGDADTFRTWIKGEE